MSEIKKISKATGVMGFATLLSRIAGLVRDMVVAGLFGAGFASDAFFTAFTLPNLLRRFFAEGSLTAAFVPTFSSVLQKEGEEEAKKVFRISMTLLVLVMAGVTVVGIVASPWLVKMIGYGYASVPGKLALTDYLNRLMFPYIFFVSLLALFTGVLNVRGHFFIPSFSTVMLNLAMIASAWLLGSYFEWPITGLAIGVLIGGLIQVLMPMPVLMRVNMVPGIDFNFRHPAVRHIVKLMLPGIAGVAIYQINTVVSRLLASFLPEGSVSFLYYSQRLFEFPQGIFVVSLAQAVLPTLCRQASNDDHDGFKDSLRYALTLILVGTLPAAVGLWACAEPIYSLFFMKGEFSFISVQATARALAAYAPGLVFVGISRVVVPAFYAMHDTKTPVWISFWTLLINFIFGLLLMGPLLHVGLALALTISAFANSVMLLWCLRRRMGPLGLKALAVTSIKALLAAAVMGIVVAVLLRYGAWSLPGHSLEKGAILCAAVAAGVIIYAAGCVMLRIPEASALAGLLRRKLKGSKQ